MRDDPVDEPAFERGEILLAEVLGATGPRITPVEIQAPEIVIPDGELPEHILQRLAHITRHTAGVLCLYLPALGMGHAQQAEGELTRQGPSHRRAPHFRGDALIVYGALLIERAGTKQRAHMPAESRA